MHVRVMDERRFNAQGDLVTESEATVTLGVGNELRHEVAFAFACEADHLLGGGLRRHRETGDLTDLRLKLRELSHR